MNLLFHIKNLESSAFAKEIYEIQQDLNYPGLIKECRRLIIKYDLSNFIDNTTNLTKLGWKNIVKRKILNHSEENLKEQFQHNTKFKDGPLCQNNEVEKYQNHVQNTNSDDTC